MYEGAGFVKGAGPVSCARLRVTAGVGARASDRCRLSGWVVALALRAFPSGVSRERGVVLAGSAAEACIRAVVAHDGIGGHGQVGLNQFDDRNVSLGSCRSSSSQPGRVRVSRGCLDRREAADLAVA